MSILSEIKIIKENLGKIKEKLNLNKSQGQQSQSSMFSSMEIKKSSVISKIDKSENQTANDKFSKVLTKSKKNTFRVTYLKDSIQFMDLKSILNLTLVNKEFNYFLLSIYFYIFMKQIKNYKMNFTKKKSEKLIEKENEKEKVKEKVKEKSSTQRLLGNFVGAFSNALGFSSTTSTKSKNLQIDPKLLTEKINTWENILKIKFRNFEISQKLKQQREEIDSLISERTSKKDLSSHSGLGGIFKDKEIEQIKREKIEKEYINLNEEILSLRKEHESLKEIINSLQIEEIEKEKVLSSLNIYINNNISIEDIKITPDDKLKSGKLGEINADIQTMTLYNQYND